MGLVSHLGILTWGATATLCLFTFVLFRYTQSHQQIGRFLLISGLFSILLMVDDLFMLHEKLFKWTTHQPEVVLQAIYGAVLVSILVVFRHIILSTHYLLLLGAMIFFGASVVIDVKHILSGSILLEALFKFYGLLSWFGYFAQTSYQHLVNLPQSNLSQPSNSFA